MMMKMSANEMGWLLLSVVVAGHLNHLLKRASFHPLSCLTGGRPAVPTHGRHPASPADAEDRDRGENRRSTQVDRLLLTACHTLISL